MPPGDEYCKKAAELIARSAQEPDPLQRVDLRKLAQAYLRLAEQAERNAASDIYKTPRHDQPNVQQQQQLQSPRKDDESR